MKKFFLCCFISLLSFGVPTKTQSAWSHTASIHCGAGSAPEIQVAPKLARSQGTNEYANVRCGIEDRIGNLWFATAGEGVYRFDGKTFTQFTVNDGLSDNTVWSLLEDKAGTIWAGTGMGLCRFDGKSFRSVPVIGGYSGSLAPTGSNQTSVSVWSLYQDKKGMLWLGTSGGVFCSDRIGFTPFLKEKGIVNREGLKLAAVCQIHEDRTGDFWFASGIPAGEEGVCRLSANSISSLKPLGDKWVRKIVEDRDGTMYFATRQHGVCRYDGKAFTNITAKAGIANGSVTSLLQDRSGNLWIGTELGSGQLGEDGGVWKFDGANFSRYTTKDGLVHNGVWSILEDRNGNLWFGTRNIGLSRFNGQSFTNY